MNLPDEQQDVAGNVNCADRKVIMEDQLSRIRSNVSNLENAQDAMRLARGSLNKVKEYGKQSETLVSNFPAIKQISMLKYNFDQVSSIYKQFVDMESNMHRVEDLMKSDAATDQVSSLPLVRALLKKMCDFREQILTLLKAHQPATNPETAASCAGSPLRTLSTYFKRLDALQTEFDTFFWSIPPKLNSFMLDGRSKDIVIFMVVLESLDSASRSRFFTALDTMVSEKFGPIVQMAQGFQKDSGNLQSILDMLAFYETDLRAIREHFVDCCPPSFQVMDFYVMLYHRNLNGILSTLIKPPRKPETPTPGAATARKLQGSLSKSGHLAGKKSTASVAQASGNSAAPVASNLEERLKVSHILAIFEWISVYEEKMQSTFKVDPSELEPRIIDSKTEAALMQQCVQSARALLQQWAANLYTAEAESFQLRSELPSLNADDLYYSDAIGFLNNMIRQQIETVSSCLQPKLVLLILDECVKVVEGFQDKLTRMAKNESLRVLHPPKSSSGNGNSSSTPAPPYFEEYVMMLGNNCLRFPVLMEDLLEILQEAIPSPDGLKAAEKRVDEMSEGFMQVGKACAEILSQIIMRTIQIGANSLFTSEWYAQSATSPIANILATFEDYFTDYQNHLEPLLFAKLVTLLNEHLLVTYLEAMLQRNSKLKMKAGLVNNVALLMDKDLRSMSNFFSEYRDEGKVAKLLEPLQDLRFHLIVASKSNILEKAVEFIKDYPDVTTAYIIEVLSRRDDLDPAFVKTFAEDFKKRRSAKASEASSQSIFSRIKQSLYR